MAIEPDAGEVAEQRHELRPIGVRQRRLEQRGDVAAQMRGVAGAEQHDVDARLMAREAVGRLDHVGGAGLVHQEAERIVGRAEPWLDQTLGGERLHLAGDPRRIGKNAAHREHDQRADALLARRRKHVAPRALVHHVEAHHEHLPDRIVHRALERLVGVIEDRILGEPDMPDLALRLLFEQARAPACRARSRT